MTIENDIAATVRAGLAGRGTKLATNFTVIERHSVNPAKAEPRISDLIAQLTTFRREFGDMPVYHSGIDPLGTVSIARESSTDGTRYIVVL